jgi:hypothetical protein
MIRQNFHTTSLSSSFPLFFLPPRLDDDFFGRRPEDDGDEE